MLNDCSVWSQQVMTKQEKETIVDLKKCNFTELAEYFKVKTEERKSMSKEQKLVSGLLLSFSVFVQLSSDKVT